MRNRFSNLDDEEETKIDITPMLDVVFIMLIFFIVTATFVNETGLNFNKPERSENSDAAVVIQASKASKNEVMVKVIDAVYAAGVDKPTIAPPTE